MKNLYSKVFLVVFIILLLIYIFYYKDRTYVNKYGSQYLHIVICATHDNKDYRRLTNTLNKQNLKYKTICWGKEWKGSGYGMRMSDTLDYLNKSAYDDDLILYLDGYDVMVMGDIKEIVDKFNTFNKDIMFAAEKSLWPDISIEWAKLIPKPNESNPYLNALFIGKAKTVKKMLQQAHKHLSADDQGEFTHYFLNNQDKCDLDYKCSIFQCLNKVDIKKDLILDKRVLNVEFNNKPVIIHGNSTDGKYKLEYIDSNLK